MTDENRTPPGGEPSEPPAQRATPRSRLGPTGFGNGPILASGIVVGGALLFAGWGFVHMASEDGGIAAALAGDDKPTVHAPAPAGDSPAGGDEDGTVTVTLPDRDRNGIPDAFEKGGVEGDDADSSSDDRETGRGDEDDPDGSRGADEAEPGSEPKTQTYVIQPGDTLTEISGETGVPVGVLVEENRIQNPNLIYAGASLLIPPV